VTPPPPLLQVEGLHVVYRERGRASRAVGGVDLSLSAGETLAVVGESGCGKTTLGLAILGLVSRPGNIDAGGVLFAGRDLRALSPDDLRRIRGRDISMIFQDAAAGLNPVLSVGTQVEEIVRAHRSVSKREARDLAETALRRQGLPAPERLLSLYPFQLSGGMAQRVMIAIATALQPRLIIADEPTSHLDVTVQAGILRELQELKRGSGAAMLLITHDLGVVARLADRVAVMYAGRIVESGDATTVFSRPSHPYTAALLAARPRIDAGDVPLAAIRGAPPDLASLTGLCAFLPRCSKAVTACRADPWPQLAGQPSGSAAACFNPMYYAG